MRVGYDLYESELIGPIGIFVSDRGLEKIILFEEKLWDYLKQHPEIKRERKLCSEVKKQLHEYFTGQRKSFDVKMYIDGTPFRKKVWEGLMTIPYGETLSYGELAAWTGNPKASRAVGGANRANQIPIIIPCHRVIGKNGEMVGFAGDKMDTKIKLLELEKTFAKSRCE